jgi:hypothetical protein
MDGPMPRADPPEEPIDRQMLLTNATLYWLTRTAGSSSWTYYEGTAGMPTDQTKVPTGVSHPGPGIRRLAERKNTIVHWSDNHSPSHMVAMAVPDQLVGDIGSSSADCGDAGRGLRLSLGLCILCVERRARSTWPGQPRWPLIWEAA